MTPEAQRMEIAKACGWKRIPKPAPELEMQEAGCATLRMEWWDYMFLPDYLNDLNACHEMEKVLGDTRELNQWSFYCHQLNQIACKRVQCGNTRTCRYTIAATAAQRCEAFLRTVGKWEDSQ